MTTPSGADEPADRHVSPDPSRPARRVRRHSGPDEPARRWGTPESERDELWGDAAPEPSERLRREVPPHHGG